MKHEINKAYEITDAKIQFVSLVGKAANKRTFLLTKAADGSATFESTGRIIKADETQHYVTGIVYEPMAEDTDGNFMTAEEIAKAAHWFAKNGTGVDLQHSFKPMDGASVVESWIAKADFSIDGEKVTEGTWLMTMEITDEDVWDGIVKGDITGFSMGGVGSYSEDDVPLEKDAQPEKDADEKRGLLHKMAEALRVKKGKVADNYKRNIVYRELDSAIEALRYAIGIRDWEGNYSIEPDDDKIREALDDFEEIIMKLRADTQPVEKSGKSLSGKNYGALKDIHEQLGTFLSEFDEENAEKKKEEEVSEDMAKEEIEKMVNDMVQNALTKAADETAPATETAPAETAPATEAPTEAVTAETVEKMVNDAVAAQTEELSGMIEKSVKEAIAPFLQSRGLPTTLDSVEKTEDEKPQCFLHGIL